MSRETTMRVLAAALSAALAAFALSPVVAADFDGSKPLLCATVQAMDCQAGEDCYAGFPDAIGAPPFLRIDPAKKLIVGPYRSSPILLLDSSSNQLLFQGNELGYGWTIAIDQQSGRMAATLADRTGVFVLFGSCTVP
jgi:hypothetical protein